MSLLPLFRWLAGSTLGVWMKNSTYGFAVVEMVHLIGLAVLGGSVLLADLKVLQLIRLRQTAAQIVRQLQPLVIVGLITLVCSGVLLVADGPLRYYGNAAFRIKMLLLVLATIFYFVLHRKVLESEGTANAKWAARVVAATSLLLWVGVALAGRAIGLL